MAVDSELSIPGEGFDDHGLARLAQVPARDVWHNEADDFTPWLASNLDVLFDHLELDVGEVTYVRTEVPVGPFRLDLMVLTESGRRIAIENQLDTSDHSHLGQLLLYAAGLEADVLV